MKQPIRAEILLTVIGPDGGTYEFEEISDSGGLANFIIPAGSSIDRLVANSTVPGFSNIASVIGAVGGGAVTALFNSPALFGWYCIGLIVGFFAYLIIGVTVLKDSQWLGQ